MKYENGITEEQRQMMMIEGDNMVDNEDMQDRWKMNEYRGHAERYDIFPEDDTLGKITISR